MCNRTEVALMFTLSKLWYVCQVLPLSGSYAKKFESLLSSFLFCGKPECLKLEDLFLPSIKGGLGLIDLRNKTNYLLVQ